ncbi:MAG: hypothetical protein ACT4PW_13775 [Acidimicrobiia bacterium]
MEHEGARLDRQPRVGLRVKLPLILAVAALLFAATACSRKQQFANISYEQRGACNTGLGPNQAYIAFQVYRIDNLGGKAKDFAFDPAKLYIEGTDPKLFLSPAINVGQPKPLRAQVVAAKSVATPEAVALVKVPTPQADGARDGATTHYTLAYDNPEDGAKQQVSLSSRDEDRTTWDYTPDCADVNYGAKS